MSRGGGSSSCGAAAETAETAGAAGARAALRFAPSFDVRDAARGVDLPLAVRGAAAAPGVPARLADRAVDARFELVAVELGFAFAFTFAFAFFTAFLGFATGAR